MHLLEPYFNWRHLYAAEEDPNSPFFGQTYSEFQFTQTVYNYYIHPQWDDFGSSTLYLKLLFTDYELGYAIIELIGEWNDAIENDIMTLKRDLIDTMISKGVYKYILIGENVLNFHSSDDSYYEEWYEDVSDENGWIVLLNLPEQSRYDMQKVRLGKYLEMMDLPQWRTFTPMNLYTLVDNFILQRLSS